MHPFPVDCHIYIYPLTSNFHPHFHFPSHTHLHFSFPPVLTSNSSRLHLSPLLDLPYALTYTSTSLPTSTCPSPLPHLALASHPHQPRLPPPSPPRPSRTPSIPTSPNLYLPISSLTPLQHLPPGLTPLPIAAALYEYGGAMAYWLLWHQSTNHSRHGL